MKKTIICLAASAALATTSAHAFNVFATGVDITDHTAIPANVHHAVFVPFNSNGHEGSLYNVTCTLSTTDTTPEGSAAKFSLAGLPPSVSMEFANDGGALASYDPNAQVAVKGVTTLAFDNVILPDIATVHPGIWVSNLDGAATLTIAACNALAVIS